MIEYIDVLNEEGVLTGTTKTREEIHTDGDWHRAVHVWVINSSEEVLLQRRSKNKINHPNMWDISVAGHISAGELPIPSAIREIEEEIGITIEENELTKIGEIKSESIINNGTYINREINDVFLIRKDIPLEQLQGQESEVDSLMYIPLSEFKKWIAEKNPELVNHEEEFNLLFSSL